MTPRTLSSTCLSAPTAVAEAVTGLPMRGDAPLLVLWRALEVNGSRRHARGRRHNGAGRRPIGQP